VAGLTMHVLPGLQSMFSLHPAIQYGFDDTSQTTARRTKTTAINLMMCVQCIFLFYLVFNRDLLYLSCCYFNDGVGEAILAMNVKQSILSVFIGSIRLL